MHLHSPWKIMATQEGYIRDTTQTPSLVRQANQYTQIHGTDSLPPLPLRLHRYAHPWGGGVYIGLYLNYSVYFRKSNKLEEQFRAALSSTLQVEWKVDVYRLVGTSV